MAVFTWNVTVNLRDLSTHFFDTSMLSDTKYAAMVNVDKKWITEEESSEATALLSLTKFNE